MKQFVLFLISVGAGVLLALMDSRPGWDDAGITAAAVFAATVALGAAGPERPWLWAAGVGIWIPLAGILVGGNYGSLMALAVAFAGAYAGYALNRIMK